MRTCPACGKENEDNVTRCATCDEEIGAGTTDAEAVHESGAAAENGAAGHDNETLAVPLDELRRQVTRDEVREKDASNETRLHPAVATADPEVDHNTLMAPHHDTVSEKPADESGAPSTTALVSEKPASATAVEEAPRAAQVTQQVPVEPAGRAAQTFQPGTVKLVVEQGMSVNKEYLLNDPELIIGRRDPEQEFIPDIDLFDQENANNRYISRRQARLYFQEGHLFVEDLDSSNGTCVNNRPIKPNMSVQLNAGDKLLLGQSVMFRIRPMTS